MMFMSALHFPEDICMDIEPEDIENKEEQWVCFEISGYDVFFSGIQTHNL